MNYLLTNLAIFLAQYSDVYSTSSSEGVVLGIFIICYAFLGCIFLVDLILRIVSIIDIINDDTNKDKALWVVIVLFVPFANVYYYFVQRGKKKAQPTVQVVNQYVQPTQPVQPPVA